MTLGGIPYTDLVNPQVVIVPTNAGLGYKGKEATTIGYVQTPQIELSPSVPTPVGYQWQVASLYIPLIGQAVLEQEYKEKVTGQVSVRCELFRGGQLAFIKKVTADLLRRSTYGEAMTCDVTVSEDFTNRLVISSGTNLGIRFTAQIAVYREKEKEPAAEGEQAAAKYNPWLIPGFEGVPYKIAEGPLSGAETTVYPQNGIINYGLVRT